jgi:hypothetical protein
LPTPLTDARSDRRSRLPSPTLEFDRHLCLGFGNGIGNDPAHPPTRQAGCPPHNHRRRSRCLLQPSHRRPPVVVGLRIGHGNGRGYGHGLTVERGKRRVHPTERAREAGENPARPPPLSPGTRRS